MARRRCCSWYEFMVPHLYLPAWGFHYIMYISLFSHHWLFLFILFLMILILRSGFVMLTSKPITPGWSGSPVLSGGKVHSYFIAQVFSVWTAIINYLDKRILRSFLEISKFIRFLSSSHTIGLLFSSWLEWSPESTMRASLLFSHWNIFSRLPVVIWSRLEPCWAWMPEVRILDYRKNVAYEDPFVFSSSVLEMPQLSEDLIGRLTTDEAVAAETSLIILQIRQNVRW